MSKSIQLVKQSTVFLPDQSSFKLIVEAVNPENMTSKIFVNQRIHNFAKGGFEDFFRAICTPTQLEDFDEDAPSEGTSFFRSNKIELVARTPEALKDVFDSILFEVKKLVVDLTALDDLNNAQTYLINAAGPIEIIE
jgi:hypothetical protein